MKFGLRSIDERSLVYFADNPRELLEAYVECGEGLTGAGGFVIQVTKLVFQSINIVTS